MGIAPIDLQAMYSQIANVAKDAAYAQRGAQLSQDMEQANIIRNNLEQSKKVQQMQEGEATKALNQNGSNSASYGRQPKKRKSPDQPQDDAPAARIKEDYLGNTLDIMG